MSKEPDAKDNISIYVSRSLIRDIDEWCHVSTHRAGVGPFSMEVSRSGFFETAAKDLLRKLTIMKRGRL